MSELKRLNNNEMEDTKQTEYRPHASNAFRADAMLCCPCCGGDPVIIFVGNPHTKSRKVTIKCERCRLERSDATMRRDAEWCAKGAIQQWNKRAKAPDVQRSTMPNSPKDWNSYQWVYVFALFTVCAAGFIYFFAWVFSMLCK